MNRRGFLQSLIAVPLAAVAFPAVHVPAFTSGGHVWNFGAGTLAMLHGKEAVLPYRLVGKRLSIELRVNMQQYDDAMRKVVASMRQLQDRS